MKKLLSLTPLLFALLFSSAFAADPVDPEKPSKTKFEFIQSKKFNKVLIDTNTDFSRYNNLIFFPVKYDTFSISKLVALDLQKNWANFHEEEWQDILPITTEATQSVFAKNSSLKLLQNAKKDTLAFQVQLYEIYPGAYLDNRLSTAGNEYIWHYAAVSYRIVVMDTQTKEMIAMFEDSLQVKPRTKVKNNRANHRSAWKMSYKELMRDLSKELTRIVKGKYKFVKQ